MVGLGYLEYEYFEARAVELCVTPAAALEIANGIPVSSLGQTAYNRIQKCELLKARPASTMLALTDAEANHLWSDITTQLWPLGSDVTFIPGHGPVSTFGEERETNSFVSDRALAGMNHRGEALGT